uniref:Secreted protein n=1 Tax=Echinostoma caproni TaxID=27848 RepID=A0A183A1Z5_9TREM
LARVPGAGWAMQCAGFLFLRRQLATDQARLTGIVDYLLRVKASCQVRSIISLTFCVSFFCCFVDVYFYFLMFSAPNHANAGSLSP